MESSEPKSTACSCGQVLAAGVASCPSCGRWISQLELTGEGPPEADLEKIITLKGWATPDQVKQAVALQFEQAGKGRKLRLGEALVEMGVLKAEQVRQALTLQGKVPMRCPKCAKTFNVRGYRPGTRALCKVCKAPLVPPGSATDLHVDDTVGGLQQVDVGEAVAADLTDLVPGYTIERRLGAGGMGEVFLARQKSLDRLVALKILTDTLGKDQTYVQRFLSEARSAAKLSQENIVAAVDSGESKGRSYFVMEYVEGETLHDILSREKTLQEKRALGYARQIARGLKHAHQQGIIHRDIKPSNVMINFDGVAKICDFGLARDIHHDVKLTQAGHVHSSPAYASPEQCKGRRDLDHRSDMYSLGVTLFEMLTGQLPFDASVPSAIFVKHVNETPPAPNSVNRAVSPAANQLVLRLLRKHPEGRFKDYDELLAAIEDAEHGRASSGSHDTVRRLATRRGRPAWMPWAGAAVGVILLVGILFSLKGGPAAPPPPPTGGPVDAAANRELQETRAFQKNVAGQVPRYPEVKALWRSLEEKYRGTPNHPFFAGAMVEFDSLVAKEAVTLADVLVDRASRHRENGRFAAASLSLREYPAAFDGTEGHRRVEALRDVLKKTIEGRYAESKERVIVYVSSEKFDHAKKELSNLQALVSSDSGGKTLYTDDRYGEELKVLARTIDEEAILARQRDAQAKTPDATPAVPPPAKPPVVPAEVVKPAPADPAPAKPVVPKPAPAREPAPAAAAKKEAEAVVRDLFKEEYAKKAPADRGVLARKLLKLAKETKDDPVGRYVLLTEAMDLGVLAGEVELSFEAVREAVAQYDVDSASLKAAIMATAVSNARSDEQFRALARMTLGVAEEAFAAGNVDQAHKLATAALAHAKRARDVSTASAADAKVKEYAEHKDVSERLTKARETLAKNPSDAASALVVGQYAGAVKGDWTEALPLLARGSDPLFKKAAEKDLAKPADPQVQGEVGDAWFDAAEKSPEWAKAGVRARAVDWYERAFAGLTGLHRTRVEQRLAQLSAGGEKGGWLRIRTPKSFGLTGAMDEPLVLAAPANDAIVAKLEPFPAGDFDGVSVKLKLPPAGRVQGHLVFEPRAFSVTVQRQAATQVIVAETSPSRNLKVEQHPGVEEFVFDVLLEGGEYVVRVNGRETARVSTSRTTLAGVWLQANWNTARFEDVKLRRKK